MARQLAFDLPKWGGRRKGAGRPRKHPRPGLVGPGVPHLSRSAVSPRHGVHVTLRVRPGVGYLRSGTPARAIEQAIREARERLGMRIVHYVIVGNHLHLIVEAEGVEALSRGMQGFAIRVAKRINALRRRGGSVFVDRYHAHVLRSPREAARALQYVVRNYRHHTLEHLPPRWHDPLSSARFVDRAPGADAPVAAPKTWLLRVGWRSGAP
jgi:REP element-mobilizing transposase RayT